MPWDFQQTAEVVNIITKRIIAEVPSTRERAHFFHQDKEDYTRETTLL